MTTIGHIARMFSEARTNRRNAASEVGTVTGLSYRCLSSHWDGDNVMDFYTYNGEFDGNGTAHHRLVTTGGIEVNWYRQDLGIVTGADFLPAEWWDLPWRVIEDEG